MDEITVEQPQGVVANMLRDLQSTVPRDEYSSPPKKDPVSNSTVYNSELSENGDVIELDGEFDYEGYQVVRREFFAHMGEPSITFNNFKLYFNAACLKKFPSVDYVQALVNVERKSLAIRLCREEEHGAVSWCVPGSARRKPRQVTCKLFFANLFSLMGWNPDYRYKLLGKIVHAKDEYLIAFDLTATEVYQRVFKDGDKPRTSRTPVFPVDWQGQFGLPFKEHRQSMQIDVFNGYAVYAIKDIGIVKADDPQKGVAHNMASNEDNNLSGGLNNE